MDVAATSPGRKPPWLKVRLPGGGRYREVKGLVQSHGLATVCEEARCPNIGECWSEGTATVMLLGDTCTRGCRFCAVKTARIGEPVDPQEPARVAETVRQLGLNYVVLTMVDRDDLPDRGAGHVAETVRQLGERCPDTVRETLVVDFDGDREAVTTIVESGVEVFSHNLETVQRLQRSVRDPRCGFEQSLKVHRTALEVRPDVVTKSGMMFGVGEETGEVRDALRALRDAGVTLLTLGQYLQPTPRHHPVERWVTPAEFDDWRAEALEMGFEGVASGPLVRSSYKAAEIAATDLLGRRAQGA